MLCSVFSEISSYARARSYNGLAGKFVRLRIPTMQLSNAQAAIRMRNVALSDNKEIGYDVKMNGWWGLGPCSTQSYIALTHSTAFTLSVQALPYLVCVEKL